MFELDFETFYRNDIINKGHSISKDTAKIVFDEILGNFEHDSKIFDESLQDENDFLKEENDLLEDKCKRLDRQIEKLNARLAVRGLA